MSVLTQDDWKTVIAGETGAADYQSTYDTLFPLWWSAFTALGKTDFTLYLWVKLRTLEMVMAQLRKRYDVVRGTDQSQISKQFTNAKDMFDRALDELKELDPSARGVARLGVAQVGSTQPDAVENFLKFNVPRIITRGP